MYTSIQNIIFFVIIICVGIYVVHNTYSIESFKTEFEKKRDEAKKDSEKKIKDQEKVDQVDQESNIHIDIENKPNINIDVDTDEISNAVNKIHLLMKENSGKTKNTLNSLTLACSNSKLEKDTKIQNICNSLSVVLDSLLHAEQSVTGNIEPLLSVESMVNTQISTGRKKLDRINKQIDSMINLFNKDLKEEEMIKQKQINNNKEKTGKSAERLDNNKDLPRTPKKNKGRMEDSSRRGSSIGDKPEDDIGEGDYPKGSKSTPPKVPASKKDGDKGFVGKEQTYEREKKKKKTKSASQLRREKEQREKEQAERFKRQFKK